MYSLRIMKNYDISNGIFRADALNYVKNPKPSPAISELL